MPEPTKLTDRELSLKVADAFARITKLAPYVHKATGAVYTPTDIVLREADLEPLVIYVRIAAYGYPRANYFARPLDEFLEKFELTEEDR